MSIEDDELKQIVTPESLANVTESKESPDSAWVDERLSHDRQHRRFKEFIFWLAFGVCVGLYISFIGFMWLLVTHTITMQAFIAHEHILILSLALLIVPSAMLWGMVRAVYKVEASPQKYLDFISSIKNLHPMG